MIEIIIALLAAVATACAVLAAWKSYQVADRSLKFQKNYAKNKIKIDRLNFSISKLRTLKLLVLNPLTVSDEKFETLDPLLNEIKADLEGLQELDLYDYKGSIFSRTSSLAQIIDEMPNDSRYIEEAIQSLEKRLNEIFE